MKELLIACALGFLLVGCSSTTASNPTTPSPAMDTVTPTSLPSSTAVATTTLVPKNSSASASQTIATPTPTNSAGALTRATATTMPSGATDSQVGYLEGHVTIGPLLPVQRVDQPTPVIPPAVYAARSINIYRSDGVTLVTNVKIGPDGNYRVALAPGTYVVALAKSGVDRAAGLPKSITIETGKTIQLDISIDTGIR